MSGFITLALLALLCAYSLRWVGQKTRLPVPSHTTVIVVFVLVVLALYGRTLN